jgi:hypothetical protein
MTSVGIGQLLVLGFSYLFLDLSSHLLVVCWWLLANYWELITDYLFGAKVESSGQENLLKGNHTDEATECLGDAGDLGGVEPGRGVLCGMGGL